MLVIYAIEDHFPNMPNDAKTVVATYREASILPFFDDRMDIQFINLLEWANGERQ